MKKRSFLFIISIFLLLLTGINFVEAYAQSPAETRAQSSFLNVVLNFAILLVVCSCFFYTKRIESFLKGGELSFGWFLILISFFVLVLLQFMILGNSMNIFELNTDFYSFLKLAWVILLGWGIYRLKKVLS